MSLSYDPKNLIFYFEELIVSMMTGLGYCVNAESKDLRVVIVLGSGGWYNTIASHKRSLTPII